MLALRFLDIHTNIFDTFNFGVEKLSQTSDKTTNFPHSKKHSDLEILKGNLKCRETRCVSEATVGQRVKRKRFERERHGRGWRYSVTHCEMFNWRVSNSGGSAGLGYKRERKVYRRNGGTFSSICWRRVGRSWEHAPVKRPVTRTNE